MIPHLFFDLLFALLQEEAANREQLFHALALTSHELKTPLTTIKGSLQLAQRQLRQQPGGEASGLEKIDRLLATALRQADHLTLLVSDLNDLSERRAGHLALQVCPCDLRDIVRQGVEGSTLLAPERSIHQALPGEPITAVVDPQRIAQVIVNLLTNALKYSADHLPIRVALEERGDEIALSVRDEGPGLTLEAQGRIWEAFYREPSSTAQVGPRSGLGLG
ncbi:MAG: sensor histidine kinase, partial [Ktedonobacterales bacterium]|nr:sensor histidine kinase [Ktedonobacterales bacterium]